ncbi:MAG TPA: hypothetical protein VLA23_04780 [Candidatus Limnocylindrales bacterium]|nr:hypothetical protein [Candidatus Limnocylindrales bacterium]
MPGFFETLERDDEALQLARRLAGGCRRCERTLLPEARRQVRREAADRVATRRLLRRHRRHGAAIGNRPGASSV